MKIRKLKNRSKPYMLDIGLVNGMRQRQFFSSKEKAEAMLKTIAERKAALPAAAMALPLHKQMEYASLEQRVSKIGMTILQCVMYAEAHYIPAETKSLADAIKACVDARRVSGKRKVYVEGLRRSLAAFQRSLGDDNASMLCSQVTRAQIEAWAHHKAALATTRGRLIDARTLFSFCLRRHWITRNPIDGIEPIKLEDKPPGIMTVENVALFLKAIRENDPAILGYICPILFGGLRPIESQHLTQEQIKSDCIEVTGAKSKTRKRRFTPINETLAAWLAVPGVEFGKLPRSRQVDTCRWIAGGRKMIGKKRDIAAFPWSHDILRHSFCSYSLVKYGAKDTAAWAGHSEQILFAHYRERVLPVESERFWNLRPEK